MISLSATIKDIKSLHVLSLAPAPRLNLARKNGMDRAIHRKSSVVMRCYYRAFNLSAINYVCLSVYLDICPDDQPELRWDVFVSYSSHDFVWVNELCQMLEQPPFNLIVCLHQRDWELGRSLQDNMVDSIYCSYKTLIIVSKHYLQSEYCMQELQLAMHSEIASEHVRKDRIVLIKIDDVSTQRLPRVLRQKSYLDSSDPEHAKHFKTNLLRVLPRRELMEEGPFEEEDNQTSDDASGSSREMRLQELPVV